MPRNGGWIPPSARTAEQLKLTNEFNEEIGTFSDVAQQVIAEPERVIIGELEIALLGQLMPRLWQLTGSCVGVGGAHAYACAACGDVYFRQDWEEVKIPFPFATYGVGRSYQWNSTGEGSFGSLQARACKPTEFGILPWDDPRVPKPNIRDGWAQWSASQEKQWSHPKAWPEPLGELTPDAQKFGLYTVTQAKTPEEVKSALAQGYGCTIASMMGTKRSVVKGDVAIAEWTDSWAHQMSLDAYWTHPQHGLIFWCQNSWGPSPSIHASCPTMSQFGIDGGFWYTASTLKKILDSRDAECFVHSATGGFPAQTFDWGQMGWNYG